MKQQMKELSTLQLRLHCTDYTKSKWLLTFSKHFLNCIIKLSIVVNIFLVMARQYTQSDSDGHIYGY